MFHWQYVSLIFRMIFGCKNTHFFLHGKNYFLHIIKSAYLCSRKFNSIIVMTAVDIRAAINNDLNTFSMDMLQVVADYVRSMRKKKEGAGMPITPLVASMFTGHSVNITDEQLDAARAEYLQEKYL